MTTIILAGAMYEPAPRKRRRALRHPLRALRARKQRQFELQFWALVHRHDWLQYDRPEDDA